MLSDRCLSCPVCDVGVLWPNGWIDQVANGVAVGLGPGDFVLDEDPTPSSPKGGQTPKKFFSAHVYCGQTAGWMKLVLGMEVGLSPGDLC